MFVYNNWIKGGPELDQGFNAISSTLLCSLLATALWAKSVNSLNGVNNRLKTLWATTGEDGWETVENTIKK